MVGHGRYYGAIIPSALTVFSMQGFLVLNCIVGGQMLASVSSGHLDDTLGIVIIGIISFAVSPKRMWPVYLLRSSSQVTFCGYKVIHWYVTPPHIAGHHFYVFLRYESVAWIPNVIAFIVMLGVGGKHLSNAPPPEPLTAASIITFGTTTASSVISWCMMTPDYGVYHDARASR